MAFSRYDSFADKLSSDWLETMGRRLHIYDKARTYVRAAFLNLACMDANGRTRKINSFGH